MYRSSSMLRTVRCFCSLSTIRTDESEKFSRFFSFSSPRVVPRSTAESENSIGDGSVHGKLVRWRNRPDAIAFIAIKPAATRSRGRPVGLGPRSVSLRRTAPLDFSYILVLFAITVKTDLPITSALIATYSGTLIMVSVYSHAIDPFLCTKWNINQTQTVMLPSLQHHACQLKLIRFSSSIRVTDSWNRLQQRIGHCELKEFVPRVTLNKRTRDFDGFVREPAGSLEPGSKITADFSNNRDIHGTNLRWHCVQETSLSQQWRALLFSKIHSVSNWLLESWLPR